MKRILLITLCYNEEYLLHPFINYYQQYCDKLLFIDGGSTDNSKQIIESYEKCQYIRDEANDANESVFLKIKNHLWKDYRNDYDYVIIVDVDEFLYYPTGIFGLIEDMEKSSCSIIQPNGFSMVERYRNVPVYDYKFEHKFVYTKGIEDNNYNKNCLFNIKDIEDINFHPGAHFSTPTGNIRHFIHKDLKLLHYKYIGLEEFLERVKINRERLSEENKKNGWGYHNLASDSEHKAYFEEILLKAKEVVYDEN